MFSLEVDTGTGGYSLIYNNVSDLLKDINEDYNITSTCSHKLTKWLYNRDFKHNKNIFKYDNVLVEVY